MERRIFGSEREQMVGGWSVLLSELGDVCAYLR